eukprot:TRINITY_DN2542_c0_g1_i3.p1 TRINITY_DN2542_c0_g1~~TRINITY_DN2542_c0_g1_i3.p1  ORF type:complete len:700 (+),score=151.76 TRINITY_DN2542_c0_g1_i3:56-2155(+)
MSENPRKEEKYDIRRLRQELGAVPFKYEYPNASGKGSAVNVISTGGAQVASAPSTKHRIVSEGKLTSQSSLSQLRAADQNSAFDLNQNTADDDAGLDGRDSPTDAALGISHREGFNEAHLIEDHDDAELSNKFFSGFKDLYGFIKTSLATMRRQSRALRHMETSIKELQTGFQKQQEDLAQLANRNRDLEQQFMVVRIGDAMTKMKGKDGATDGEGLGNAGLFAQSGMTTNPSPRGQKKQQAPQAKENRVREQEIREIVSRFEHQIADIHIDLSKKQASMDRQSFQIHTIKEKMESIDVRDELKDVRKFVDGQGSTVKILQGQVSEILADKRVDELQEGYKDLTGKFASLQSRTNTWFTDLSAQFGVLKEEAAQHKNTIYEKLYERVREDIARQTNRCFKELKILSDHCNGKFEAYDADMTYFRDEVPRKIDKEDLVTGLSDVDPTKVTNFRTLLVSQILQEIQDTFDGSIGFSSAVEPPMILENTTAKKTAKSRDSNAPPSRQGRDGHRYSLSPELAQAKFDLGGTKSRIPLVKEESLEVVDSNNVVQGKPSDKGISQSRVGSPGDSEVSSRNPTGATSQIEKGAPLDGSGLGNRDDSFYVTSESDTENGKQVGHSGDPSSSPNIQSRVQSPNGRITTSAAADPPRTAEQLAPVASLSITAEDLQMQKEGRPQTTVHMASQIQTVLTKFYGVSKYSMS